MTLDDERGLRDSGCRFICIQTERQSEFLDLRQLMQSVWRSKWKILAFTAICASLGFTYAMMATPYYRAEAVLMPREGRVGSGLAVQFSQLAGLADLAGIGMGPVGRQEPLGVIRSRGFARRFIEGNALSDPLVSHLSDGRMTHVARGPSSYDMQDLVDYFVRSVVSIAEDKKTGLVVVSVRWIDPVVAADWANRLVRQINEEMRQRTLQESEGNIRYLKGQLKDTDVISVQQSISRVLEAEMQKLMLASGSSEYAFRVVDDAQPPIRRESPKRMLIVMSSVLGGLIVALLIALMIEPVRNFVADLRGG